MYFLWEQLISTVHSLGGCQVELDIFETWPQKYYISNGINLKPKDNLIKTFDALFSL